MESYLRGTTVLIFVHSSQHSVCTRRGTPGSSNLVRAWTNTSIYGIRALGSSCNSLLSNRSAGHGLSGSKHSAVG